MIFWGLSNVKSKGYRTGEEILPFLWKSIENIFLLTIIFADSRLY